MGDEINNLFEKEGTVSQPASSIMKIIVLQRFDHVLRSWEIWSSAKENTNDKITALLKLKSSLRVLIAILKPRWEIEKKETFTECMNNIEMKQDVCIDLIAYYLDRDLGLTTIDTVEKYERNIISRSNKHHGYT